MTPRIQRPSPVAIFGYFVGKFEKRVRPFLDREEYKFAQVEIGDLYMKHQVISKDIDLETGIAGSLYLNAIGALKVFADSEDKSGAVFALCMARRNIAQLDFMLSGNVEYEEMRDRKN